MSANSLKRAVIFAHYDRDGLVDDYVLYYLSSLRKVCGFIVFVSTAELSQAELGKVQNLAEVVIKRENVGHDFFSYKAGLDELRKHAPESYSEVILCNDSVYGPLYPMEEMFAAMERTGADFWGVTEAQELAHHLQSYFLVFRRSVLQSAPFLDFWAAMAPLSDRAEIVRRYEVGLSQLLEARGFKAAAYVKAGAFSSRGYARLMAARLKKLFTMPRAELRSKLGKFFSGASSMHPNPTFTLWRELLVEKRNPFLKISLLRYNPAGVKIEDYPEIIKNATVYDARLIAKHLARVEPSGPKI